MNMKTPPVNKMYQKAKSTDSYSVEPQEEPIHVQIVRREAPSTGTYGAALIATSCVVPVVASFISVVFFITLPQTLLPRLMAPLSGTVLTLLVWLILAVPYRRYTAVDFANTTKYELLLSRLCQLESWFKILEPEFTPKTNSLYEISKQEVRNSCDTIYEGLIKKSASWVLGTGYVNMWKLLHRADEAFIYIEPVEAVIHNALHDEMSLQNSTLTNKEDLLKKLRKAVKMLDKRAATYLNQQPPQEEETEANGYEKPNVSADQRGKLKSTFGSLAFFSGNFRRKINRDDMQNTLESEQSSDQSKVRPKDLSNGYSDDINIKTQARTIIREVRNTLHQFRDGRWEKLVRVRNHLVRMTILTGIALCLLLEFAILADADKQMIIAATVFYLVGAIVGLFSRLYDQARSETAVDDFNLAAARLLAAQLYSGIAAIGGVVIVQRAILASANVFNLNLTNILIAAAFGLTPSLFTSAIQKEAEQYKTDLKSTAAPTTEKKTTTTQ
jgi:hypothetical protein